MQIIQSNRPRYSDAIGQLADVVRQGKMADQENQRQQDVIQGQKDIATQKTAAEQAKARADAIQTVLLNKDADQQSWARAHEILRSSDPEAAKWIPDISSLPESQFQQAKRSLAMQDVNLQSQQTQIRSGEAAKMIAGTPNRTSAALVFNPGSAGTSPFNQSQLADVLGGRFSSKPPSPDELAAGKVEAKIAPSADVVTQEAGQTKREGMRQAGETTRKKMDIAQRAAATNTTAGGIQPRTPEFRVATDLASGLMTFAQFRTIYAYSRDAKLKAAIYDKARDLNPEFNPAMFERGIKIASNPKIVQQVAAQDNALSLIPEMTQVSDEATRVGPTVFNSMINKTGYAFGGKKYTDLRVMQKVFADEVSGALGFGSATDMTRELGLTMADLDLSSPNFRSAMNKIESAMQKKRSSLVNQMGVYGQWVNAASAGGGGAQPSQKNAPQRLQKQQRNPSTGATRVVYSDDGGATWHP